MGLDQSEFLTVGSLVAKEGRHSLPHNTLLVIPPWCSKPPLCYHKEGPYQDRPPLCPFRL